MEGESIGTASVLLSSHPHAAHPPLSDYVALENCEQTNIFTHLFSYRQSILYIYIFRQSLSSTYATNMTHTSGDNSDNIYIFKTTIRTLYLKLYSHRLKYSIVALLYLQTHTDADEDVRFPTHIIQYNTVKLWL